MKLVLLFFILIFSGLNSAAQNFVTRWNLSNPGSGITQLQFNATIAVGGANFTWQEISPGNSSGSGVLAAGTALRTITGLPAGATIRLFIAPTNLQRFFIIYGTDRLRLVNVENWGTAAWINMTSAFSGCSNLNITATDIPNLSGVSNMSEMFLNCSNLNGPANINSWNTAAVNNMFAMFSEATAFNQNISNWNTAAVTDMSRMFASAIAFNQNISNWNTAAVTNMGQMFQ